MNLILWGSAILYIKIKNLERVTTVITFRVIPVTITLSIVY